VRVAYFLLIAVFFGNSHSWAATYITFRSNTGSAYGRIVSGSGSDLTTGGLSVGYFAGNPPNADFLKSLSPNTAWDALVNYGYVDLRSIPNTLLLTDLDWSFESNPQNSPYSSSSAIRGGVYLDPGLSETQLYVLAFNAGSWDFNSNSMSTATFGGSEWGVISRISDPNPNKSWFITSDRASGFIFAISLQNDDVLIGSLSPNYATDVSVRMSSVPEPSVTGMLILLTGLLLLRKPYLSLFK